MKAFLVNYQFTPTWLLNSGLDYVIHDRSDTRDWLKDFPQDRIIYEENIGQVDFPKLSYLVENYDNLPDVFLWSKTNLHKFITEEEWDKVKDNKTFTPLLTQHHKTYSDKYGVVNFYKDGWYWERNDNWYLNSNFPKYFESFDEWAKQIGIRSPRYIPFAPGGSYILTKEKVHKYSRDLYANMASCLPWAVTPGEAQLCERSYGLLWGDIMV